MSDLKHLDELNRLPLPYFEGRKERELGLRFRAKARESDEDSRFRLCGHADFESCVSALERARKEEEEQ